MFGAQVGTTSYDTITDVIKPTEPAARLRHERRRDRRPSRRKQIDGIVVDLPTAFYITNVQLDNATIVGQFDGRHAGALQRGPGKGSALTPCINAAIKSTDRRRHPRG